MSHSVSLSAFLLLSGLARAAAPSNDDCASASLILGTGPYPGDTTTATTDGPAACGGLGADVWYEWIAPVSGSTTVSLCDSGTTFDTALAVYVGGCGGSLVACNDDSVCLHGGTLSRLTFTAAAGVSYLIRIGGAAGATGAYVMRITLPAQLGADSCSSPERVAGPGPHAFDLSVATTGLEGQTNGICSFAGTMAIASDVWFAWTAPESGPTTISTCGQTALNTKLAVYLGSGCPSGAPLDCDDDTCASQSSVTITATKGATYSIQLGVVPGALPFGGGTFKVTGPQPADGCLYDAGVSTGHSGLGPVGGEQAFLQGFGSPGLQTLVHSISVAYGNPSHSGEAPPVGSLVVLSIFDDPDDDAIPDDLVLVATRSSVIHGVDADEFAASALDEPVLVDGVYFAVVSVTTVAGDYPMAYEDGPASGGMTWIAAEPMQGLDYSDLPGHTFFGDVAVLVTPVSWLIRVDCEPLITPFCTPGSAGVVACPCGNPPSGPDRGCDNHGAASGGASLAGSGFPSLGSDSLVLSAADENLTSLTIFWTGSSLISPPGAVHGAGVRCVSALKRLYSGNASGGAIARPGGSDPSVSARSSAVGAAITSGQTRYYFTIYRDNLAVGPCGNTASNINVSNALRVRWMP